VWTTLALSGYFARGGRVKERGRGKDRKSVYRLIFTGSA
jgi:hypothetical protein